MGQEQDYEMETQNDILTKAKADYPKRAQSTPYNISVKYQQLMFQLSKIINFSRFVTILTPSPYLTFSSGISPKISSFRTD